MGGGGGGGVLFNGALRTTKGTLGSRGVTGVTCRYWGRIFAIVAKILPCSNFSPAT